MGYGAHPTRDCVACGRLMMIAGRGMCSSCYSKDWKERHPEAADERWRYAEEPTAKNGPKARTPFGSTFNGSVQTNHLPPREDDMDFLSSLVMDPIR